MRGNEKKYKSKLGEKTCHNPQVDNHDNHTTNQHRIMSSVVAYFRNMINSDPKGKEHGQRAVISELQKLDDRVNRKLAHGKLLGQLSKPMKAKQTKQTKQTRKPKQARKPKQTELRFDFTENPSFNEVDEELMDGACFEALYETSSKRKHIWIKDPRFKGRFDLMCKDCHSILLDPYELRGSCSGCDTCTQ